MVVQFGFAMIPLRASRTACGFTSLTTSGTSGSIRQAEELSTTRTPASANRGASAREVVAPAEKTAMSSPLGSAFSASSTTTSRSPQVRVVPADRAEAKNRSSPTGKSRSSRTWRITAPTWPVAPTTPRLTRFVIEAPAGGRAEGAVSWGDSSARSAVDDGLDLLGLEVERGVRRRDGVVHLRLVDDDRDPDLRGRDHLDVDAGGSEGGEELRGDAGVRTHAGADQRHLADLVVVEQPVVTDGVLDARERRHRALAVVARQRERDVGEVGGSRRDVLHNHVEVDLHVRERLEDPRRLTDLVGDSDDGDLGLAAVVGDAGDDRLLHLGSFCSGQGWV